MDFTNAVSSPQQNRSILFQLVECAKYFLSRVEVIMDPKYEPTDSDIVQARVQTEGIIEHEFEMSSSRGDVKKKLILVR